MPKKTDCFSESKTGTAHDTEDASVVTDHFAAVIDGASNVSGRLINGKSPGKHAAALVKESISALKGPESIDEIVHLINENFQRFYHENKLTEEMTNIPYLRPSAAMVLYSEHYKKVWLIGDCQCYMNGRHYQHLKEIDTITSRARAMLVESELAQGKSVEDIMADDRSFELIKPMIQSQYHFQNRPPSEKYSYEVLNGFHMYMESVQAVDVPVNTETLAFASDGYPKIFGTLAETEEHLASVLARDPLCIHENMSVRGLVKGRVSYDDRTYLKVAL